MGLDSALHALSLTFRVFVIDLLLSGDNAVVIALACRSLPPAQMRQAMVIGTATAIVLRVIFTTFTSFLLSLPLLKLVGGVALTAIAIKLVLDEDDAADPAARLAHKPVALRSAAGIVIFADLVMSGDNVVALAAATQGNLFFLVFGLLLSVPFLMFGSLFVTALLTRYPLLIRGGAALLGWLAGDIAIADPLITNWVNQQSPALTVVVPILVAVFVLAESRIIEQTRATAVRPMPRPPRPASTQAAIDTTDSEAKSEPAAIQGNDTPAVEGFATAPTPLRATTETHRPVSTPRSDPHPASAWIVGSFTGLVIGAILFAAMHWKDLLPTPGGLKRYACPGGDTFYYHPGANSVRMSSPNGSIEGVRHNEKIDWGDYATANIALGFQPPVEIRQIDAKSVRINGGRYVDIDCFLR